MKHINILTIILLFSVSANADLVSDGQKEFTKGNEEKAVELWTKACDSGNAEGCYKLGRVYFNRPGARQDKRKARVLFGKACDGGHKKGCTYYRILNAAGVK